MMGLGNQRGVAMMAVMGAALLFGTTLVLVLALSINRAKSSRHGVERVSAVYAAEAGYWWALAQVFDDPAFVDGAGDVDFTVAAGRGPQQFDVDVVVENIPGAPGHKRVRATVRYEDF